MSDFDMGPATANHRTCPSSEPRFANPFFAILLVVGILFAVTASAYGVMTIRDARGGGENDIPMSLAGARLLAWLDAYGVRMMFAEVVLLAICTFAAIFTDEFWTRRWKKKLTTKPEGERSCDDACA